MTSETAWPERERARSVQLVPAAGSESGHSRVDKRFHHPGLIGRLRDGARAKREAALLAHLKRAGVRVPTPTEVVREKRGWTVRMELIPGARTLHERLESELARPLAARIARDLGEQVGRLHAAGVDHPDLHAGNVLVDAEERVWLIDFSQAHLRKLTPASIERDLLRAESFLRERLPTSIRLRALSAHLAALPDGLSYERTERMHLARRLAQRAPAFRRAVVARGAGRWLRASGQVAEIAGDEGPRLVRRELGPLPPRPRDDPAEDRLVVRDTPARLRSRWLATAAAWEHALPVAVPWCLQLGGPDPFALFHLPRWGGTSAQELAQRLEDRGLVAEPFETVRGPAGGLFLRPPLRLCAR